MSILAEHGVRDPGQPPRLFTSLLGWLTMALAVLMALIPRAFPNSAVHSIGTLLMLAGVLEVMVGATAARWSTGSILGSGLLTMTAALIIFLGGEHTFFTLSAIVTVWLLGRSALLLILTFRAPWRAARTWLLVSSMANVLLFALAVLIMVSVVVAHALFGPVPKGAGYSAVPALSLFINGLWFAAAVTAPRADRPA